MSLERGHAEPRDSFPNPVRLLANCAAAGWALTVALPAVALRTFIRRITGS